MGPLTRPDHQSQADEFGVIAVLPLNLKEFDTAVQRRRDRR
jgi:hypothetical protein